MCDTSASALLRECTCVPQHFPIHQNIGSGVAKIFTISIYKTFTISIHNRTDLALDGFSVCFTFPGCNTSSRMQRQSIVLLLLFWFMPCITFDVRIDARDLHMKELTFPIANLFWIFVRGNSQAQGPALFHTAIATIFSGVFARDFRRECLAFW